MNEKELLKAVYGTRLSQGLATVDAVSLALGETPEEVALGLEEASRGGLVEVRGREIALTPKGRAKMRVVMIGGAFEIIHPGHLHTITEAKRFGNTLVVVVATDRTVSKNKGREPVTTQDWRVKLVAALREVDVA